MKFSKPQWAGKSFLFIVLFVAGLFTESHAIKITPNWDSSVTKQAQKDVILFAISEVEGKFPGNTNFTITIKNALLVSAPGPAPNEEWAMKVVNGTRLTLASTDTGDPDANGCPISATTTFNIDQTGIAWYWSVNTPVPAGKDDGLTIARHELIHAIGFSTNYPKFAGKVDVDRKFKCGAVSAQLIPTTTHLDSTVVGQIGDLMIELPREEGTRTPISPLDRNMLLCAFPACYPLGGGGGPDTSFVPLTSTGGKVGLIVLLALGGAAAIFAFSRKRLAG